MSNQSGKAAIVTGGSRGIGRAIVKALAEAGYNVAFSYASNQAAAEEVEAMVKGFGVDALAVKSDAASVTDAQALIEQAHKRFGRIDALVNNAGITRDGLLMRMSDEDWAKVIDTNLAGAFYTCRAASRIMLKQRAGAIVNISSVVGVFGNAGQANYAASKAGLIGFTKSLAKEFGSRGVTANVLAPGFIETDMTESVPKEQLLQHIPLGRLGAPEDIAKAVLFLITSGDYITGQVIHVDGGLVF
ncbi:3-oxoacyl-[acyl-carrier-protein] reductase [Vampirovibrio chlorellavorus]|uniref:3-oxoacyl-[acyl-carrier-protein] reductase n=1 Tax=Vampirovibrio chlorellavorus TaxID=758823 RepID=UPI0026F04BDC|nr:3-oxoacyl-[acyl-carrier-protein] reductase [Vampirovibrio chlorellavorus]